MEGVQNCFWRSNHDFVAKPAVEASLYPLVSLCAAPRDAGWLRVPWCESVARAPRSGVPGGDEGGVAAYRRRPASRRTGLKRGGVVVRCLCTLGKWHTLGCLRCEGYLQPRTGFAGTAHRLCGDGGGPASERHYKTHAGQ